jgi:tRNA (mo5U34)-methyltransferase
LLQRFADLTREVMVVETHLTPRGDPREDGMDATPLMAFYPDREWANDPTNWWGPNEACMIELLKMVGFKRVSSLRTSKYRGTFHAWK